MVTAGVWTGMAGRSPQTAASDDDPDGEATGVQNRTRATASTVRPRRRRVLALSGTALAAVVAGCSGGGGDGGSDGDDGTPTPSQYPPGVVDDFEDGDLGEYVGDTDRFGFLEESADGEGRSLAGQDGAIVSTAGLGAYPSAGDRFRVRGLIAGMAVSPSLWVGYAVQSESTEADRYQVGVNFGAVDLECRKVVDGTVEKKATEGFSPLDLSRSDWFDLTVDWKSDGTHTLTVQGEGEDEAAGEVTMTDGEFTGGGVMWAVEGGDEEDRMLFDDAKVL